MEVGDFSVSASAIQAASFHLPKTSLRTAKGRDAAILAAGRFEFRDVSLAPVDLNVAEPAPVHFLAKLFGVFFYAVASQPITIADMMAQFHLTSNVLIECQQALVLRL
jgi:hypothetical protein